MKYKEHITKEIYDNIIIVFVVSTCYDKSGGSGEPVSLIRQINHLKNVCMPNSGAPIIGNID